MIPVPIKAMIHASLCSITYRTLAADRIIELATSASLHSIEWGGDVHVPPGDIATAHAVREATERASLRIAGYGSYYRAGVTDPAEFDAVLKSAVALGAPFIRVWAGNVASADADRDTFSNAALNLRDIAALAERDSIRIVCEFHRNTLCDDLASTNMILSKVDHPNLWLHWQPQANHSLSQGLDELRAFLLRLSHIHVFEWQPDPTNKRPLIEGNDHWPAYLREASLAPRDLDAMIEFLPQETKTDLMRDALVLHHWIASIR